MKNKRLSALVLLVALLALSSVPFARASVSLDVVATGRISATNTGTTHVAVTPANVGELIAVMISTEDTSVATCGSERTVSSVSDSTGSVVFTEAPGGPVCSTTGGHVGISDVWHGVTFSTSAQTVTVTMTGSTNLVLFTAAFFTLFGETVVASSTGLCNNGGSCAAIATTSSSPSYAAGEVVIGTATSSSGDMSSPGASFTALNYFTGAGETPSCAADAVANACFQYIVPSGSGSTNFPANLQVSNRDWSDIGVVFGPSTVTLPITCTMDNGATQATVTISGGSPSPSPSTVLCDGGAHNVVVQASTTITATEPADGANSRDRFSGGGTTTTQASCSVGICSTWSFTNFLELQNTYQMTPTVPATWDHAYSELAIGTQGGAASTTLCTITLTNGGGAANCSGWGDYSRLASLPASFASAVAGTWTAQGTLSWTDTTGGNTHNTKYILSGTATSFCVSYKLLNGGVFNAPTLSYVSASVSTQLTVTKTSQCVTADALTAWSITNPLTGPSASTVERAFTQNTTSGTITGSMTLVAVYWHQFSFSVRYQIVTGTPNPADRPTFTYKTFASSTTINNQKTYTQIWVDSGTPWTAQNPWFSNLINFYANPSGGVAIAPIGDLTIHYTNSGCISTNPSTLWNTGCIAGAFYYTWYPLMGNFGMGMIFMVVGVGLYLKSENPMVPITILLLIGGVFGTFVLPAFFFPLSAILLVLGIVGGIYQVARER